MINTDLIIKVLRENLQPVKVILFGSYAKGKFHKDSDLDIAVIQKKPVKLGQKAKLFLALEKLDYDWSVEPDIHLFSEKEFDNKMKQKDLFVTEISKGRVLYA